MSEGTPQAPRRRWILRSVLGAGLLSVTFSAALLGGALLHVSARPSRRLVASVLTSVLTRTFLGRVVIERIDRIDAMGFDGASASVYDPAGVRVLAVSGLRGRASLFDISKRILRGTDDLEIVVSRARVEHVEVTFLPDEQGVPSLARAFTPRPSPTTDDLSGPSPRVRVWLPDVEMATAHAQGSIAGLDHLDVDLANVMGSVLAGTERTSIAVRRFALSVAGLAPKNAQGTAETRIEIPSSTGRALSVWSTFDGYLGDVQINVRGGLDGDEVHFTADATKARPEAVRELFPPWPIIDNANLHVRARGVPPNLVARGTARVGLGVAEFAGELGFAGGLHTNLAVEVRDIDLRSIVATAPATSIDASATVNLAVKGKLEGTIVATTEPLLIDGLEVPAASIDAKIDGPRVSGQVTLRDPTLVSHIDFDTHPGPNDAPLVTELEWTARVPEMERVSWLAPIGSGEARWRAQGEIVDGRLRADVDATVTRFSRPALALDEGHLRGTLRGPLAALVVSASLEGRGFQAGPLHFPELSAKVEGPLDRFTVSAAVAGENAAQLGARASVQRTPSGTALRDVELTASRDDIVLGGKVGAIDVTADRVDFRQIVVEGMGQPIIGSLSVSPSTLRIRLSSSDLDLKKLGTVLAPAAKMEGRLAFDVDAEIEGRVERGHARLHLENGGFSGFSGIQALVEGDIQSGRFSGGADVTWGDLGTLTATTADASLAGSAWQASSWAEATGRLQVDTTMNLDRLTQRFAPVLGPFAQAGGEARLKLLISRPESADDARAPTDRKTPPPDVDLLLWTSALRVGPSAGTISDGVASPGFVSEGTDVQLALHIEGDKHESQLAARLVDAEGLFAGLTVSADVRLAELWAHRDELADRLLGMPLMAQLTLPRRGISAYPGWTRLSGWRGDIEGTGLWTGSIRSPAMGLTVRGYGVEPLNAGLALPFDIEAGGSYDGKKAVARLIASRPAGVVLDANTEVVAPLEKLLSRAPGNDEKWWEASGGARVFRFPLASLPALSENQVDGLASGALTFRGLNRDPEVEAEVVCTDVKLDAAVFPRGVAVLRLAKERLVASAMLEQKDGGASATASARVQWTSPVIPEVNSREPVDLFVEARNLRAVALYPLLFQGIFSEFDGRLNGTLHLHQEGDGDQVAESVKGAFDFRDGTLQIPEIGQQFRNASAHIVVSEHGEVQVTDVSANGVTGRLTASGKLKLRGFSFVSGEGDVRIAKKEAVPLTVEGVSLGDAWGTLLLHAKMSNDHTVKLDIAVPVFHADMPESSARNVQALGDHPEIEIGVRKGESALSRVLIGPPQEKRAEDALAWHVTFYLGQDVVIRRGSMMELVIGGKPVVELTDEARVSGEVDFRSGKVEVFGKRFDIVHGSAKFEGEDPGNPNVAVTARWDAPDGTRVFADFVGPLRTGLLSLRSEPARSQRDILAIMLFGSTDARTPGPGPGFQTQSRQTANAGAVLAGGAVTTNVNRVLSSVTPLDITTRVTSDSQSPTPEVAVRLSPKVTAQVSYRTRAPKPTERQDRVLVTLDWRFRRNWSIATTVGDRGSSVVDLIWKYRY